MDIFLQLRSKIPIYEQIITQVKQHIMSGRLKDGDPIPSMRALAKTLQVSVITVQKAYEELQRAGLIESLAGRGTFIRVSNSDDIRQEYLNIITERVRDIVKLAKEGDISMDEIINLLSHSEKEKII